MLELTKKRYRLRIVIPAYPAFNIYSRIARGTTALGPVCVASSANKMEKWDIEVIDENNLRRYGPKAKSTGADHEFLQSLRPADVAGFYGGLTSTIPRLYQVAKFYQDQGVITVAGGQHFLEDNVSEALNSGIDYVVIGEGEEVIRELLEAFEGRRQLDTIKGIAYKDKQGNITYTEKREPIMDFEKLPLPDFSLVRYAKMKLYPVERIRGCGMDCEFCTVKGKPRFSSAERMIERISLIMETKDARHFFIVDDLFGQQRDETIRFCHMLRDYQKNVRRRLDFSVQIRLDKARDHELLSAMREAGINTVAIGFESPIEEELKAMNKRTKPEEMLELTRIFHKHGFLIHGMFIFGYPMEEGVSFNMSGQERVKRFRNFIKKAKLDTIQVLLPGPLSGTELRKRLMRQNRVYPLSDVGWEYYDGNFPLFQPDPPLTAEEVHICVRKIMTNFYHFKHVLNIGLNIFSFPALVFFAHDITYGWRIWYRSWRNNLLRFGGWITAKEWMAKFNKDPFSQKLQQAKEHLKNR